MVSVIVPIYNSQEYLDECIQSIIYQSYKELEIILIDDGSTDNSQQICERYLAEDSRVVYVRKKNGGVSSSRNLGLEIAQGEYIVFVDADDYLEKGIIQHVINVMEHDSSELVVWNATEVHGDKLKCCKPISKQSGNKEEIYASIISNYHDKFYMGDYIRAVWGKMFRLDVIKNNNIKFNEQLYIGEDAIFLIQYLSHINRINNMNEYGYYYRILSSSAVRRYKPDLLQQSRMQLESYENIIGNKIDNPIINTSLCVFEWNTLHSLVNNEKHGLNNGLIKGKYVASDVYQWVKFIKKSKYKCSIKPRWSSKIVQLLVIFGKKMPCKVNVYLICIYNILKNN